MADKTKRKQVGKSKRAISNEDEVSFQTDITRVINKTNQLNITYIMKHTLLQVFIQAEKRVQQFL